MAIVIEDVSAPTSEMTPEEFSKMNTIILEMLDLINGHKVPIGIALNAAVRVATFIAVDSKYEVEGFLAGVRTTYERIKAAESTGNAGAS